MIGALLVCFWISIVFMGALAGTIFCLTIIKGL